ncbi:MAG: CRTAC1 family protein [Bacteroidota bacterium]
MSRWWLVWILMGTSLWNSACQRVSEATQTEQIAALPPAFHAFYTPENLYANQVQIAYFDSLLRIAPEGERLPLYYRRAVSLLYAGRNEEAVEWLEKLWQLFQTHGALPGLTLDQEADVPYRLATAYVRLGEEQNCQLNHGPESCLLPIQGSGIHQLPEGSQAAIDLLEQSLRDRPGDLSAQWLLNVAYMTLGQFPEGVPEAYRLPVDALDSEYPLLPFAEVAGKVGLDANGLSGGVVLDDFNGDGYLDVMVSEWHPLGKIQLFLHDQAGGFVEHTQAAGLANLPGALNLLQADYDNDGDLDVLLLRGAWLGEFGHQPNALLRNNGDSTFTEVTEAAGLLSYHPTQTAVWQDFNLDGWVDLFIGNESQGGTEVHPCELYLNQQDGTFREVAEEAYVSLTGSPLAWKNAFVKGVASGDYDRDGRPDLYLSLYSDQRPNILLRNVETLPNGVPRFDLETYSAGLEEEPFYSFPTWLFDWDNDGWEDIFVAGYARSEVIGSITSDIFKEYSGQPHRSLTPRLYHNQGDGTFQEISEQIGLDRIVYAMGANYGDLDNDGWLDFYAGTGEVNLESIIPNRMFRNDAGKAFQEVSTAGGFAHIQKGHGIAFGDLDQDGDQDVYANMGGALEGDVFWNALFENPYQDSAAWITLQLVGQRANRSAIGSRLHLEVELSDGQVRHLYRTISSGGSFGASPLRAEIGLGQAVRLQKLTIEWAGSESQVISDLPLRRGYQIVEGQAPQEWKGKATPFSAQDTPHSHASAPH